MSAIDTAETVPDVLTALIDSVSATCWVGTTFDTSRAAELADQAAQRVHQVLAEPPGLTAQLTRLLNRHSAENGSDTPDFLLADYLIRCLDNWNVTVGRRESWYGR